MFAHGYQKLFISLGRTAQGVENMSIPVAIVSASYVTVVELVGSVLVLAGALITVVAGCYLVVMVGAAVFVHIPTASSPRTTAGNSSAQSRRSCSRWPPQGPAGGASSVPGRAPSRHSSRCRRPRQRLLSRDCGTTALRRPDNDRCPHLHRSIRSRTMPLPRQKAAVRDDGRAPGWGVPRAATPRRARAHLERPCLPCLHGQPNVPPGTLRDCRVKLGTFPEAQAGAVVCGAGRFTDRAGSATKQSFTTASPNAPSSRRWRSSRLGASQIHIPRLTSSCVTLPRSAKPGGRLRSPLITRSHPAGSRISCTTPRCITTSSLSRGGEYPARPPWS